MINNIYIQCESFSLVQNYNLKKYIIRATRAFHASSITFKRQKSARNYTARMKRFASSRT